MAACRALDAAFCLPLLGEVFVRAEVEGIAVPGDLLVTASLMLGMLNGAAALIAASPNDGALLRRVSACVVAFIEKLFA